MKSDRSVMRWICAGGLVAYAAWAVFVTVTDRGVDYYTYVIAAYAMSHGLNIYRVPPEGYAPIAASLGITNFAPPYRYPPLTALAVLPLTWLPLRAGAFLWVFGSGIAALGAALLAGAHADAAWKKRLILLAAIGYVPIWTTLHAGQVNTFVLLAAAAAIYSLRRQRALAAGILIAVSLMLKPFVFLLVGLLVWRGQWKALAGVVVTIGLITLAGIAVFGLDSALAQFDAYTSTISTSALGPLANNQNLNGLLGRWLGGLPPQSAFSIYLAAAALFALATAVALLPPGKSARPIELEAALLIVITHFIVPQTWYHHLAMTFIAIAVLIEHWDGWRKPAWDQLALLAAYILTNVFGLVYKQLSGTVWLLDLATWSTLALWVLLIIRLRHPADMPAEHVTHGGDRPAGARPAWIP